jgi:hypothetical protein
MPIPSKKNSPDLPPDIIKDSPQDYLDIDIESLDLEGRLKREWYRQNEIFKHAKRHRIESVMLSCLASMNSIAKVLGYEPHE